VTTNSESIEDEINDLGMGGRPHVFLVGAGASFATFPNGDRNGIRLPLMNNLVEVLGLAPLFEAYGIEYNVANFEETYARIYSDPKLSDLTKELESTTYSYFSKMSLPDVPTIYDYLVLCLRKKDLIATFNWDPFLWQAWSRICQLIGPKYLPNIAFLHGNVASGYCREDNTKGPIWSVCGKCNRPFIPSRLLYPIKEKNYNKDLYISGEWATLRRHLEIAFMLTIFGYSAPESDVEAVNIMKAAWGNPYNRNLEEIEIIDIKKEAELSNTWKQFIHTHHYQTCTNFYQSWVANHPRRSCEAMWNQLMEGQFLDGTMIPRECDFGRLLRWYEPLLQAEAIESDSKVIK
jgi:hypothetical protein